MIFAAAGENQVILNCLVNATIAFKTDDCSCNHQTRISYSKLKKKWVLNFFVSGPNAFKIDI